MTTLGPAMDPLRRRPPPPALDPQDQMLEAEVAMAEAVGLYPGQLHACWWLSLVVLGGLGLNALAGWWWADPVAAFGVAGFLVHEGREAWEGEDCCPS